MAEPFESPVDVEALVPPSALPGVAQMAVAIGIASFLALALNTHALAAWTAALPPDPRVAALDAAAGHDLEMSFCFYHAICLIQCWRQGSM